MCVGVCVFDVNVELNQVDRIWSRCVGGDGRAGGSEKIDKFAISGKETMTIITPCSVIASPHDTAMLQGE